MKKQFLSVLILSMMLLPQAACFADINYRYQYQNTVQQLPQQTGYRTQYPMPEYSYQTQTPSYNAGNSSDYGYYNANNNNYGNYGNNTLQGNVVMVPANTVFKAVLTAPLSSETAKLGDSVSMYLPSDFYYGNTLIAGAGSKINGSVVKVKKGGLGVRKGQMQIKFNTLITPSGQIIPISASIQTNDGSGVLKAGTAADTAKTYTRNTAIGAASGAVMGLVMGALSGGSVGKGAIYGTAVGGGMGLLSPILERGGNVELPQNAQFDIVLDQPVTVSSNTRY